MKHFWLVGLAAATLLAGCDSNPKARVPSKAPEQTVATVAHKPKAEEDRSPLLIKTLTPRQQALAMTLLDMPLKFAPGRYSQYILPDGSGSFPLFLGKKTGRPMASAGVSHAGRRYVAFGTVPVTYEFEPFRDNLKELMGWLMTGNTVSAYRKGSTVALAHLGIQERKVVGWLRRYMPGLTLARCDVLGLDDCLKGADLVITGVEGDTDQAKTLVSAFKAQPQLPILYLHTQFWKQSDFARPVLRMLHLKQGETGGNYWAQDAANWKNVTDMFQTEVSLNTYNNRLAP